MDAGFFERDAETVARELLGKTMIIKGKKAKIVETEAYYDDKDPASRACKNGDLKETMKMKPGTILVYGVHNNWLINFVTGKEGEAEAVLIRAVEPLNFNEKASGPGLLAKALGIDKSFHRKHLIDDRGYLDLTLDLTEGERDFGIIESCRIGVKKDLKKKLRFYIKDNGFVSKK